MLRGEKMMKRKYILGFLLFVFVLWLTGCKQQLGETRAEVIRGHDRTIQISCQEFLDDVDKTLLLDQPSKLTDKRIP
jgi:hypothetical protein